MYNSVPVNALFSSSADSLSYLPYVMQPLNYKQYVQKWNEVVLEITALVLLCTQKGSLSILAKNISETLKFLFKIGFEKYNNYYVSDIY